MMVIEQARRADRHEQKAEACGERRQRTPRVMRGRRRRRHHGKRRVLKAGDGMQEPAAKVQKLVISSKKRR